MADVLRLIKAVSAITFSPMGRGSLCILPVDARLHVTGQSSMPGFVDVTNGDELYCLFNVDLIARSVALRTMAVAA